jgi:hypothetical protein
MKRDMDNMLARMRQSANTELDEDPHLNGEAFDEDAVEGEERPARGSDIPPELPILPLRGLVVYPQTAIPLTVGRAASSWWMMWWLATG